MAKFLLGRRWRKTAATNNRLRGFLWRIDATVLSLLLFLFRLLPLKQASRFGYHFGRFVGPRLEKHRHLISNLSIAFPGLDAKSRDRLAREIWANGGAVMAEYTQLDRICGRRFDECIKIEVDEEIQAFREQGKPSVFVTAHLSNWELAAAATVKLGVRLTSLYSPPVNPLIASRLMSEREAMGSHLLSRDASARDLLRVLQNGESLGVVMDRRVDNGEPMPFFGQAKKTSLIPARLAVKFGCELIPIQIQRISGVSFRIRYHRPIRPSDPNQSELDQAIDMTRQVNELFADWIRAAPQEWLCTKRLWDKDLHKRNSVGNQGVSLDLRGAG